MERKVDEWRILALEERGLKMCRYKTKYMSCNEHEDSDIHLQVETIKS